jgi:hypothetical protein
VNGISIGEEIQECRHRGLKWAIPW